jgi:hypothetical protein
MAVYYGIVVQEHIGLCAPRMPKLRPQNAEKPDKKRPFFTEENEVLHRHHRRAPPECRILSIGPMAGPDEPSRAPRMPNPGRLRNGKRPRNAERLQLDFNPAFPRP